MGEEPQLGADAIVVAYRSAEVIGRCVDALRADPAVLGIVVVNNSPGDGTREVVERVPDLVYLDSPGNVGFGPAVNCARAHVHQEYVVLANPDAVQDPGTSASLVRFLADRPRGALVGPRMVDEQGRLYRNSQRDLSFVRLMFQSLGRPRSLGLARSRRDHERAHVTDYAIGSFVMCRVRALDSIGWFDESIFLFGEDQDLCRRLRNAGWEVWFAPVGTVEHLAGHSWRQLEDRGRALFKEARYRELRKAGGRVGAEMYRALVRAKDLARRMSGRVSGTGG